MLKKLYLFQSGSFDPYANLAIEKHLLDCVPEDACILYLWQNENTVVIGANQNPWAECRCELLQSEGGHLARRLSGGGAVFHDLGNLNFTFLSHIDNYDLDSQLAVIEKACSAADICTQRSGRNDLLAQGRKFSGNAFYQSHGRAYHHGTLLISTDEDKMQRYLSPPAAKLEAKGVASVRSRIVNLSSLAPALTCENMKQLMAVSFASVYELHVEPWSISNDAWPQIDDLRRHYESWEYLFGTPLPFTFSCQERFEWGHVTLQLQVKGGVVLAAKVYTDAMDWRFSAVAEQALCGCSFKKDAMQTALHASTEDAAIASDLCQMLTQIL